LSYIETNFLLQDITMHELLLSMVTAKAPVLASLIWVGGGSIGLIVLIVVIFLILR
jgi:hypothetical protein